MGSLSDGPFSSDYVSHSKLDTSIDPLIHSPKPNQTIGFIHWVTFRIASLIPSFSKQQRKNGFGNDYNVSGNASNSSVGEMGKKNE